MVALEFYTHIVLACSLAYGLDYFLLDFSVSESIFFYIFLIIGSILPDVDTPNSFIGRRIKPFSNIINKTVGHRTLTHSILVITIIFFAGVLLWEINTIVVGLMLGAVLHVLGDMLTPQGVALVYPVSKKRYKILK